MTTLEVFWSFRSPYCYLALDRLLEIARRSTAKVQIRPVWPLAIRTPSFFQHVNSNHLAYHAMDSRRVAEYHAIPYRRPVPDPIIQDMETGEIAHDQPYIYRLTRLGAAATVRDKGLAFVDHVSRLLWDGTVDGWNQEPHLSAAIRKTGLAPKVLQNEIETNPSLYDKLIADNQHALEDAGHWGVPTFVFENEPFFGQDRMNTLVWRMKQHGVYPNHIT